LPPLPATGTLIPVGGEGSAIGTCFFVSADGLAACSYDVLKADPAAAAVTLPDGRTVEIEGVAAIDPAGDLALLKLATDGLPAVSLEQVRLPGSDAYVALAGRPGRSKAAHATGRVVTLTNISGRLVGLEVTAEIVSTDGGAPVVDRDGKLIGVASSFLSRMTGRNVVVPAQRVVGMIARRGELQSLAAAGPYLDRKQAAELDEARLAIRGDDLERADMLLRQLSRTADNKPEVWHAVGDLRQQQRRLEDAARAYQRAGDLQSATPALYRKLGDLYRRLDRPALAETAITRAVALDPTDPASLFELGRWRYKAKDFARAAEIFEKAVAADPGDSLYQSWLGNAYWQLGRAEEALAAYRKSIELDPTSARSEKIRQLIDQLEGDGP
jgi:Flp pilus assembly protein TadD